MDGKSESENKEAGASSKALRPETMTDDNSEVRKHIISSIGVAAAGLFVGLGLGLGLFSVGKSFDFDGIGRGFEKSFDGIGRGIERAGCGIESAGREIEKIGDKSYHNEKIGDKFYHNHEVEF